MIGCILEDFLIDNGLPALFLLSFFASTIVPLGSEWLLVALIMKAGKFEDAVAVATLGNYLGACTTYCIGVYGCGFLMQKVVRIDNDSLARAKTFYNKYGSWSLLLSWLPVIGDPLCLVGGALRLNFLLFSVLVLSGKFARYAFIAFLTAAAVN